MKPKDEFFEKINKMDKLLARMTRNNEKNHKVRKLGRKEGISVQTL